MDPVKIITIEGLVGAGKSVQVTLLKKALVNYDVIFLEEPVESWIELGLVQGVYNGTLSPVAFQLAVLVSLIGPLLKAVLKRPKLVISERSPFSSYHVFAKANLGGVELSTYDYTFRELMSTLPPVETTMILLDVSKDVASRRMQSRRGSSEGSISLDYLEVLEAKHRELGREVPEARLVFVDASGTPETTFEAVLSCVHEVFDPSYSR